MHQYVECSLLTTCDGIPITDDEINALTSYYLDDYQDCHWFAELISGTPAERQTDVTVTFQCKRYAPDVVVLTTIVDSPRKIEPDESSSCHDSNLWHISVWFIHVEMDGALVPADNSYQTFQDWVWH